MSEFLQGANTAIYQYIADIVTMFGFSDKEVKDLALIAKVALSQKLGELDREDWIIQEKNIEAFIYYFPDNTMKEIIKSLRVVEVKFPDNYDFELK